MASIQHADIDHTGLTGVGVGDATAHIADTTDAHDASAISFAPAGTIAATNVQDAIEEVASEAAGAGTGQGLVDFATAKRTSGDQTLNNTSWTNLDTGTDLTLTAATGDWIEVGWGGCCNGGAVNLAFDAATIVGGSPVNYVSGGAGGAANLGVGAWISGSNGGNGTTTGGAVLYQLVSGDISGGTVTLRMRYRSGTATNKVLNASTALPWAWYAKNLGGSL